MTCCPGVLLVLTATGAIALPTCFSTSARSGPVLYVTLSVLSTLVLFITVELLMIVTLVELST